MTRKFKIVIFIILLTCVCFAQAQKTKLSPSAAKMLKQVEVGKCESGSVYAFVTLADNVDIKTLDNYGVKVNSVAGGMMTVQIPSKGYRDFVASNICAYIDLGDELHPQLDIVRADLGVDYIHHGINLPQGYDGSGVVVGVIDAGFEYGHPSFFDSTGTELRIKRVWQQRDTLGTAPTNFSYGRELADSTSILAAVTDEPTLGHGSHVLGIAAGCGAPDATGSRYRGMAPAADIVLVATNMKPPCVVDGIRYIHEYARSVQKPCVINISLGSNTGPHDGNDMIDRMIANYIDQLDSIVIVVAASNDGGEPHHLHQQFTATDTVLRTFCNWPFASEFNFGVDCWGGVNDQFSLSVALYNRPTDTSITYVAETPFVSTDVDSIYTFSLTSQDSNVYECILEVIASDPNNHRPEIWVGITNEDDSLILSDVFALTLKSTTADVHLWTDYLEFSSNRMEQFSDGDDDYSIGGVSANSDAVISVGSYATRSYKVSESGSVLGFSMTEEGDLSEFSSHGPTWDGRAKPDICAPGQSVVSAINTPYLEYYGTFLVFDSTDFRGQTYYYCLMQGTSMASPVMAGITALWLQNNPSLDVDSVRAILHSTGRKDRFTGDIPATGSNLWGWGKVDAFAGLGNTAVPMHYAEVITNDY